MPRFTSAGNVDEENHYAREVKAQTQKSTQGNSWKNPWVKITPHHPFSGKNPKPKSQGLPNITPYHPRLEENMPRNPKPKKQYY